MNGPAAHVFPDCVRAVFSDGREEHPPALFKEEDEAIRNAVTSRRREFAVGRWCARRALAKLDVPPLAIPVGRSRAPMWPAGIVGSITHCQGFVGAAVARDSCLRSIGFDAERAEPLDADLVALICTPAEITWMRGFPDARGMEWAKVLFSAKEAVHKCIWPLIGQMLDFVDVTLDIDPDRGVFSARHAARTESPDVGSDAVFAQVRGRFDISNELVFTCAFVEPIPGVTLA